MRVLTLALAAAATFGVSAGAASALTVAAGAAVPAALAEPLVEEARVVCNRYGRCWRTRGHAYGHYRGPRYYGYYGRPRYYAWPGYPHYYRPAPAIGIGIGPLGIGIW
jgi:hypothetical protein